jgi:hypothetical protein
VSATPSTIRTAFRLLERQRHVERDLRLLHRGIDEVAEALYNRAVARTTTDA